MVTEPEIVLFDEPDSGLDPVRVAYLDELVVTAQKETGATFFIITHNISSVMRTAEFMGVLFRSNLVKFASKPEMLESDNPIIQQFLAGRPQGPIGMDEMADSGQDTSRFIEGDTAALAVRTAGPPGRAGAGLTRTVRPAGPAQLNRSANGETPPAPGGAARNQRRPRSAPCERLSRRRRLRTPSRR